MRLKRFFASIVVLGSASAYGATYVVPPDDVLVAKSDGIVIARALHSFTQDSKEHGIETMTMFAVEEMIKGDPSLRDGFRIHIPGGVLEVNGKRKVKAIAGAPHFVDGERLLLFITKAIPDDYGVTDLALGVFGYATDEAGQRVLIRNESEINGWDLGGAVHHEQRRDAERFLTYVRNITIGRPGAKDYVIEPRPLIGEHRPIVATGVGHPVPLAFTATQYTLSIDGIEGSTPARWNVFPAQVSFNRGSALTNAANSGSDAINSANAIWVGDPTTNINYLLTTTTPNPNGIVEAPDGVNNIVFEKNLTGLGYAAYNCSTGGLFGLGGINNTSGVTHMLNGATFDSTTEGDVSMNQGVNACVGSGLPGGISTNNLISALTHEIGHTLGLRHADRTRNNGAACSSQPTYDCASSAIMTATVTMGSAGALFAWDLRAIAALYTGSAGPPPAAPANVVATAASSTSVGLTWTASAGATSYNVLRTSDNSTYSNVGTPMTNSFTDSTATAGNAYLYKVQAVSAGGTSADSNKDLATTVIFTDATLTPQSTTIKAAHITELRTAVDAVRKLANGGVANPFSYTDPTITVQSTNVKRLHIIDLRTALDAARATLGLSALSYTDTTITATSTIVKVAHIADLRNGVR